MDLTYPIDWNTDTEEDFTAHWYGLMLRVSKADKYIWHWAVYDMDGGGHCLASSEKETVECNSASEAKRSAESVAEQFKKQA